VLDVFFVVHGEGRRLCANVRPHRDRRRERILVDSTSELMAGGDSERRLCQRHRAGCNRAGNAVAKRTYGRNECEHCH
jgi:hypothetical protein